MQAHEGLYSSLSSVHWPSWWYNRIGERPRDLGEGDYKGTNKNQGFPRLGVTWECKGMLASVSESSFLVSFILPPREAHKAKGISSSTVPNIPMPSSLCLPRLGRILLSCRSTLQWIWQDALNVVKVCHVLKNIVFLVTNTIFFSLKRDSVLIEEKHKNNTKIVH